MPQENSAGGPDVTLLSSVRETRCNPVVGLPPGLSADHQPVRLDNWRKVVHYECLQEFTGLTIFRLVGDYPDVLDSHDPSHLEERVVGLRVPREPTQNERAQRELTHLPFAPWCASCVQGKGKASRPMTSRSTLLVIQVDFTFPQFTLQGLSLIHI